MPVINLVNIPENNLVFSLHVLWYTSGAHGAHVALQEWNTSVSIRHVQISQHAASITCTIGELLLTFQWQEFFSQPKYLQLFQAPGDGLSCKLNSLEAINSQNLHKGFGGGVQADQSIEGSG